MNCHNKDLVQLGATMLKHKQSQELNQKNKINKLINVISILKRLSIKRIDSGFQPVFLKLKSHVHRILFVWWMSHGQWVMHALERMME